MNESETNSDRKTMIIFGILVMGACAFALCEIIKMLADPKNIEMLGFLLFAIIFVAVISAGFCVFYVWMIEHGFPARKIKFDRKELET